MLIRISCPNPKCKKQLRIDAKHAGKKISCTGCKQHIRLPTAEELKITVQAAGISADKPGEEQIVDFDAMAAEAVNVDKSAVETFNKTEMIEFTCPQCDEQVKLSVENSGKRAPCPSCRRIITVPKADVAKPRDWREKEAQGPSLAKKEEVKLEGAWGNEAAARVSLEALEEARALPKIRRKLTRAEYTRYGIYAAMALAIISIGWWYWGRYRAAALESNTLASIRDAVQDLKLAPDLHAIMRRGLGEWMLRTGATVDAKKDGLADLKKALTTAGDPIWTCTLANDVAELIGPLITLDVNQPAGPIDLQFLVQLISSVPSGEPREDVLRTLCRSILKNVQQQPEKMDLARNLLTAVIKQAIPPTAMAQPADKSPAAATQDYSEQLDSIGILAQELIRHQARESALNLIGKSPERGERVMYKKGMPVPKNFAAAMTALVQQDWEVAKQHEIDLELAKMTGHFLINQDAAGNEIYRKRQEGGYSEANLFSFLDIAQQAIDANRLPEALARLSQAMAIAQIYTQGRAGAWKMRVYGHVRICELTARAGEITLAEERVTKLNLDEVPTAAQVARALIARCRPVQPSDGDTLLAGLKAGSAGQALAAFSLSRKQAELVDQARTQLSNQLPEGPAKTLAALGGLIGYRINHPPKEVK